MVDVAMWLVRGGSLRAHAPRPLAWCNLAASVRLVPQAEVPHHDCGDWSCIEQPEHARRSANLTISVHTLGLRAARWRAAVLVRSVYLALHERCETKTRELVLQNQQTE